MSMCHNNSKLMTYILNELESLPLSEDGMETITKLQTKFTSSHDGISRFLMRLFLVIHS